MTLEGCQVKFWWISFDPFSCHCANEKKIMDAHTDARTTPKHNDSSPIRGGGIKM